MRRLLIFLAVVVLVAAAFPSAVGAHRSIRFTDDSTFIYCDAVTNEHGTVSLGMESGHDQPAFAFLGFESPDASETWVSRDAEVVVAADGASFSATLHLYEYFPETDEYGDAIGDATAEVTLEPVGDPQAIDYRTGRTNNRVRVQGTVQQLSASGTVILPGDLAFALSSCQGAHEVLAVAANQPDSYVASTNGVSVNCAWETESGTVFLGGWQEIGVAFVDLYMADADGEFFGGTEDVTLTGAAIEATFDLHRSAMHAEATVPGDEIVGSVTVSATMSRTTERFRFVDRFGFERYVFSGVRLDVSGTTTVSRDGEPDLVLSMNEGCFGEKFRSSYRVATPNGTPSLGRPLTNDAPQDAIALAIGSSANVRSTAGTDVQPEAPCIVGDGDEQFELPLGHTGWWSFEGNGGDVTIDTAGSGFDTVVAVYVVDDGALAQVGCVDDVDDGEGGGGLQAAISVDTDAGVTYLVQVGGYDGGYGRLELAIR